MMTTGTVKAISAKEFRGNPTFAFLLKEDESVWYNVDLSTDSKVSRGDTVSFTAEENGRSTYAKGIKVTKGPQETQARAPFKRSFRSDATGKDDYWKDKEKRDIVTQTVIQLQASRNSAIALAGVLVTSGAIPKPKKEADFADAIVALVDGLTEKFEKQSSEKRDGKVAVENEELALGQPPEEKEEEWF